MIIQSQLWKVNDYHILATSFDEAVEIFKIWRPTHEIKKVEFICSPIINKYEMKGLK